MKKTITFLLALLFINSIFAQDVYDVNTIQTIEIVFAQSNWDAILDAEKAGDNNYTEAESVTINGILYNQVGVKYKGNSSYNPNQTKNPFHIELDTYVDQNYEGTTDLKLSNVIFDPSFVRETVSYDIVRTYMHAPRSNYANVYVNGNLMGLYTNVESISKKFVNNHFGSSDNAFFSCSPPAGAGPQSNDFPNLVYLGANSADYEDAYEIKSDDETDPTIAEAHWNDLIELTNVLNNDIATIETVLDVDRALWMLAFDNVLVNLDSYIGLFKQNYYLYKGDNGRFSPVVWDLNMSFGTFGMTGASGGGPGPGGGNLNSTTQKAEMDHLLHDTDNNFPLMSKLLAVPTYKKMYLAHYKTILTEQITNSNYLTLANDYQNLIDAAVQADSNKFYSYAQFGGNINTDYGLGMLTASGLTNVMNARGSFLSALSDFTVTQPTISNVVASNTSPEIGTTISITSNVINTNTDAVMLGYRIDQHEPFTKTLMFDDGNHNDGNANDGVYGADLAISDVYTQYYIYAENNNIGAFSPARAEHEFYEIDATYATLDIGDLVINELMASNATTAADQDGEYDDWVELYNNSSEVVSLDNLYMSDDPTDLLAWQFPAGLTIAPDEYLIVWCDKDEDQVGLHADLKFSAGGESAILSYADGTIIEDITFGEQIEDMGYARNPNGTGDFVIQMPTFGVNNETLSVDSFELSDNLKLYPNPTNGMFTIENSLNTIEFVTIYNTQGQLLFQNRYQNEKQIELDVSSYSKGIYMVNINDSKVLKLIRN